jgi:hypothetical protein
VSLGPTGKFRAALEMAGLFGGRESSHGCRGRDPALVLRGPKASMGGTRASKARWVRGDLLCAPRQRRNLDANDVPEECRGKHFSARPLADQE